jgi:hypothetical protein
VGSTDSCLRYRRNQTQQLSLVVGVVFVEPFGVDTAEGRSE